MKYIKPVLFITAIWLSGIYSASGQTTCIACQANTNARATGTNAVAIGTNTVASGVNAIAIGTNDTCAGDFSNAFGFNIRALGNGSIGLGNSHTIIGPNGFAAGLSNLVNGTTSISIGSNNSATANNSISFGSYVNATGINSFGAGTFLTVSGRYGMAFGRSIQSSGFGSITIGSGASGSQPLVNNIDSSFMLGFNSTIPTFFVSSSNSSAGFGKIGIGTTTPAATLDVNGNIAVNGKSVVSIDGKWLGDTTGMAGPAGKNGATWFTGSTNPASGTGNNNDLYLNTTTDSVFQKMNNNWQALTYIKGAQGSPGTPGSNGSVWYSGITNPVDSRYNNNDLYLNIITDTVFQKLNNTWQKIAYIKGAQGTPGTPGSNGSVWYTGTTNPVNSSYNNNDLYLNTTTDTLFQKLNNTWQKIAYIKGGQGIPGLNGSTWITGSSNPVAGTGNNNDLYFNTATDSVFQKVSGNWQKIAYIKGAQGTQGPQGPQGPQGAIGPQGPTGSDGSCNLLSCAAAASGAAATAVAAALAVAIDGAIETITAAGTAQVGLVEAAGGTAVTEVQTAGATALERVEAAATEAEESAQAAKLSEDNAKQSAEQSQQYADTSRKYADEARKQVNGNASGDLSGKYPNPTVSKLQGNSISSTAPSAGQILKWENSAWTPANPDSLNYETGPGIQISDDTISSRINDPLWNANKLQGKPIDTTSPGTNQVLAWDGDKWKAKDNISAWVVDSTKKDSITMYAAIQGNVGIGTQKPVTLLQVQAGSTDNTDSAFIINHSGRVGIGTIPADTIYKLAVNGSVRAKKIVVETGWADYVFEKDYPLLPLPELEQYIRLHHHLPAVPAASVIETDGLDVAAMQVKTMEKIEELTLYMIGLMKENENLKSRIAELENQVKK